jgi:hypothetical protein
MANITRWSPDTCECIIEFEWDNIKTNTFKQTIRACSSHSGHSGKDTHLETLLEENRRKNQALHALATELGVELNPSEDKVKTLTSQKLFDSDDDKAAYEHSLLEVQKIKAGKFINNFQYNFDINRVLHVSHTLIKDKSLLKSADKVVFD